MLAVYLVLMQALHVRPFGFYIVSMCSTCGVCWPEVLFGTRMRLVLPCVRRFSKPLAGLGL